LCKLARIIGYISNMPPRVLEGNLTFLVILCTILLIGNIYVIYENRITTDTLIYAHNHLMRRLTNFRYAVLLVALILMKGRRTAVYIGILGIKQTMINHLIHINTLQPQSIPR